MKNKWVLTFTTMLVAANLAAATSIPIQRIDIANIVTTGAVGSSIMLAFNNNDIAPCATSVLAFQDMTTIWAGSGQACSTAITSITIIPIDAETSIGAIYLTPATPVMINERAYSTRLIITQNTAPVFDSINGALVTPGTIQTGVSSQFD